MLSFKLIRSNHSVENLLVATSKRTRDAGQWGSYPSTARRRAKTCEVFRVPGTARWGTCKKDSGRRKGTGDYLSK